MILHMAPESDRVQWNDGNASSRTTNESSLEEQANHPNLFGTCQPLLHCRRG